MEDQAKQFHAVERMFELLNIEAAERPSMRIGLQRFFDAGWPSNYVNLGMMRAAGKGLHPFPYRSATDMARYKEQMERGGFYVANTSTDPLRQTLP